MALPFIRAAFCWSITVIPGKYYRIDLADPENVQKVEIDQYFLGADGLLMAGSDKLTVVVNGGNDKIFQLQSEDNWKSARLSGTTLAADRLRIRPRRPGKVTISG